MLRDGAVPMDALTAKIGRWMEGTGAAP